MFPKRGAIALVVTALALVLLLSFKTPDAATTIGSVVSPDTTSSTPATGGVAGDTSTSQTTEPPTTGAASSQTVTGSMVSTRFGDVEVQITVSNGAITDVAAVALPSGGRSGQISRYVAPILASEALQAQSAAIDIVSGATYTSMAYARSLQSALDQAGIATVAVNG
jgi:uncharacterized protein with FMN-binding domain